MRLRVDGLSVRFHLPGATVHAVTDARFELREGRCLALVGESGCGKSVMAHALLGLLPANATVTGHAWLDLPAPDPAGGHARHGLPDLDAAGGHVRHGPLDEEATGGHTWHGPPDDPAVADRPQPSRSATVPQGALEEAALAGQAVSDAAVPGQGVAVAGRRVPDVEARRAHGTAARGDAATRGRRERPVAAPDVPGPVASEAGAGVTGDAPAAGGGRMIDLVAAPEKVLARQVRGRLIGLVPQSPAAHLTPVRTARAQLAETLRELGRPETPEAVAERAGLRPHDLDRYPHQLSGGMAQRVANALALAGDPPLIVADEPTTGLDRPLVDATMAELRRLCDEGRAVLVITHDLRAAEQVADDLAVMYAGRVVELAEARQFFAGPRHPYAKGLLDALPSRGFVPIPGQPPELTRLPDGCAFRPRCTLATAACDEQPIMNGVACHHA
ncbi:oligopeptide/dipeptide ABC transporter ATP-binding protein [Nonomuraea sp. SYSU D8015]|uniref:oligopeptide/dipeptide ABC transporter ATP-binding protein n=1 Tax=Nonomuraea sp. SYSU D8015 TaxID=2593644 RepID=UPI0022DD2249|nr:oligopeptide/dipeptide ABC transporter ATP-binding protein [Nonomuraea sp. SYSU D8015]